MSAGSIKYRWYQTDNEVVIEIPAKNVSAENVHVDFGTEVVMLKAKLPNDGVYKLNLNLRDGVRVEKCSFRVSPYKIELHLPKVVQYQWKDIEKEDKPQPQVPVQLKNWEKVVKENWTEEDEFDSLESSFAKIYADCDEDQRRAMIKSYTESGGTVLSANWDEVRKKKVEEYKSE